MSRGKDEKKPQRSKARSTHFDPFVGSKSVEGLDQRNYDEFLSEKEVSMIMFYDASDPQCEWSKKHFLKAAKTTYRENHGYAAVDCIRETDLCAQEGVDTLPTFKLFVGPKLLDTYTKPQAMTYHTIKKYVENTPPPSYAPPCIRPCDKEKNTCSYKK